MALLVSRATGNFTSSSTWQVAEAGTGAQLTNLTAATFTTTAYVYSSAFTGTNAVVVTGVALFLYGSSSPSGTFSVSLSEDNGATATREVTVDVADLPQGSGNASWVFFAFGSTLTLDGGTDYKVGCKSSVASQVAVSTDGTAGNWGRVLTTTTTQAPAAADTMLVVGERTGAGAGSAFVVTMNNTAATDFGTAASTTVPTPSGPQAFTGIQIGHGGTLIWGVAAATNYQLTLSGNLVVWAGGQYIMGNTSAPCPRDSTMTLRFDCATDGTHGFVSYGNCNIMMQGLSLNVDVSEWWCSLTANAVATNTVLSVDRDTRWPNGTEVAIAPTNLTLAQRETKTVSSSNATHITLTAGLTNDHLGTTPKAAEIVALTRNVRLTGNSSSVTTYMYTAGTGTLDCDWVEFRHFGGGGSANKLGVTTTTSNAQFHHCTVHTDQNGFYLNGNNIVVTNCASYSNALVGAMMYTASNNTLVDGFISMGGVHGIQMSSITSNLTVYNAKIAAANTNGILLSGNNGGQDVKMRFANVIIHTINNTAVYAGDPVHSWSDDPDFENLQIYACALYGVSGLNRSTLKFTNTTIWGCTSASVNGDSCDWVFNDFKSAGDATHLSQYGLRVGDGNITIENGEFSNTTWPYVAHSVNDVFWAFNGRSRIKMNNVLFGSSANSVWANNGSQGRSVLFTSTRHNKTAGSHKSWKPFCVTTSDQVIFYNLAPSERITPTNATYRGVSGSRLVPVDNNTTASVQVYVRKSEAADGAAYNGAQPRLIVKRNSALGIANDTVLDTMTAANGTWEALVGTTATVTDHGVLEFVVDCSGTTGWINVDDWTIT